MICMRVDMYLCDMYMYVNVILGYFRLCLTFNCEEEEAQFIFHCGSVSSFFSSKMNQISLNMYVQRTFDKNSPSKYIYNFTCVLICMRCLSL